MHQNDFSDFMRFTGLKLSGVIAWLKKLPSHRTTEAEDFEPTRGEMLHSWADELAYTSLLDAKEAVLAFQQGKETLPRDFSQFAVRIKWLAGGGHTAGKQDDDRPRMVEGEWAYKCLTCEDQGVSEVISHETQQAAIQEREKFNGPIYRMAVACRCAKGIAFSSQTKGVPLNPHDDQNMILVRRESPKELLEMLRAWGSVWQPPSNEWASTKTREEVIAASDSELF